MSRFTPASCALALAFCLLLPAAALAHKVTVFGYVEGDRIMLECFFSKSDRVKNGAVILQDAATGEELARGTTDDKGALSLPVPPKAIASGHDIKVLLKAGEGHQNDTLIQASEFAGLKPAVPAAKAPASISAKPDAKTAPKSTAKAEPQPAAATSQPALDEAALTRVVSQAVEQAVDSRMAPVKRMLLESADKGPRPTEIIGGIGYIVGLFGIAAFMAGKRKERSGK
jgi:hypothetical protein